MNLYSPRAKRVLFAILFLWSLLVFMPGSYSVDSYNYFYQFEYNDYNDWHPPIFAFAWYCMRKISGMYESIYVAQMLLYWLAGYILLVKLTTGKLGYWIGIGLLILFQFIPQYVMKDTHVTLAWGMASLLLVYLLGVEINRLKRRVIIAAILFLLVYGFLVRMNGVIAIIPLLYLLIEQIATRKLWTYSKVIIVLISVPILFALNHVITYGIFDAKKTYPEYKLMLLDITGISKKTGKNYLPPEITTYAAYDSAKLMQMYTPASFDEIYWPEDSVVAVIPMPTKAIVASTSRAWSTAVKDHPWVYLRQRLKGFLYYIRIKHRFPVREYWDVSIGIEAENPMQLCKPVHSHSSRFAMGSFRGTLFFEPWFWLLMNMVLAVYYFRRYRKEQYMQYRAMAFIQLSGVLYMLSQFPVFQHDRDFRYHYWNVIVFLIGFIFMIGKPVLTRKESPKT